MRPRGIVITGATGGIGRALVRAYAAPGVRLLLFGRDEAALDAARREAEAAGAVATTRAVPVTDHAAMADALRAFDAEAGIDLFLPAAGVKTGNRDGLEPPDQLDRVIAVNLTAVLHQVQAVLPGMLSRGSGQIALFGSLAAASPVADLLSYTATKAGITGYGVALRRAVRGTGVTVHVISPGFVDTPMTHRHGGPTPMVMSADRAARIIRTGLARGRPRISFPRLLFLLVWLENLLPAALGDRIDRAYRAEITPDPDEDAARRDQSRG